MTAQKTIYLILIVLSLMSCEKNQMSEEKILNDIFPQLVDSLNIKWRSIPPSPLPPIFDKDSNFIGVDSTKREIILAEHQKFLDRIDSIDSRIIIGITDSYFLINWNDLKSRSYSKDDLIRSLISLYQKQTSTSNKLDINQIGINDGFKLMSKSEIEEKYSNTWSILKDHKFAGLLEISKIYLLEDNNAGLLQIDYYYDPWNGYSYFIIIEKMSEKWRVKKLLRNWVT